MSVDPHYINVLYQSVFPSFLEEGFAKTEKNDFIKAVKELTKIVSGYTQKMVFLQHTDPAQYQLLNEELVRILFLDVIMTQNNELLNKTAKFWEAITIEGERLQNRDCDKTFLHKNPPKDIDNLETIFLGGDIYKEISVFICEKLNSGFLGHISFQVSSIKKSLENYSNRVFTDFHGIIPIISAFVKYGNIRKPKQFIAKLRSLAELRFSGKEKDNYRNKLDQIHADLLANDDNIYRNSSIYMTDSLEIVHQILFDRGLLKCSKEELILGFSGKENRFEIVFANVNKGQAGKIIEILAKYSFSLKPEILDKVKATFKNKHYVYRKLKESVNLYESQHKNHSNYRFMNDFVELTTELISILERKLY